MRGTRERVLQVAMEMFCTRGVQRTSMQDIAGALGLTKPALYYHFRSRQDIVESLLQPMVDDVEAFLAEHEGRPTHDAREVLSGLFDVQYAHRTAGLILLRELTALSDVIEAEAIQTWRTRTMTLLVGEEPTLEAQIRAGMAIGGLADTTLTHAARSADELKEPIVRAALTVLAGSGES